MSPFSIFMICCPSYPFGEIRRNMVHCRHYQLSTLIDYDRRPEYCRVEKIIVEEGG